MLVVRRPPFPVMTSKNYLLLRVNLDSDGTCELHAFVTSDGFSGHGSAWFDVGRVREFSKALRSYPLSETNPPHIEGGYWSESAPSTLDQVHVSIRVYPIGHRGQLGVRVVIADPPIAQEDRLDSQNRAEIELRTGYNALERFALELDAMLRSSAEKAVLPECILG